MASTVDFGASGWCSNWRGMMDSIAAAPLDGHRPMYKVHCGNHVCYKDTIRSDFHGVSTFSFTGRALIYRPFARNVKFHTRTLRKEKSVVTALAMELTKEARLPREEKFPRTLNYATELGLSPRLWPPPNKADDPSLANPLLRRERMGCGWMGVIFELEGVMIEDASDLENRSWLTLAEEEGRRPPPGFILRRIEGMKNEQAISEVLCWSRDPTEMRRLGLRKEEIYQSLRGGFYRDRSGSREFASNLMKYDIPMALVSTRPRSYVEMALRIVDIASFFTVVVTADDVHRGKPDPEMFIYASQSLNLIPERCIVFGNSNSTVEATHDAKMKCIAVAGKHPMYELGAADLVIRRLDELSMVDLKNLADIETEFHTPEPEMELEEDPLRSSAAAVDDLW